MNRTTFVLAQWGCNIALVKGDFSGLKLGDTFIRMPGRDPTTWTVIKTFEQDEHDRLVALETLSGFASLAEIFKATTLESTEYPSIVA